MPLGPPDPPMKSVARIANGTGEFNAANRLNEPDRPDSRAWPVGRRLRARPGGGWA